MLMLLIQELGGQFILLPVYLTPYALSREMDKHNFYAKYVIFCFFFKFITAMIP